LDDLSLDRFNFSTSLRLRSEMICYALGLMDAVSLERELANFLSDAQNALVVEDGAVIFDLRDARYSISGERGRCLLHLWSTERNIVRRVLEAEQKNGCLNLIVQRFGQARPQRLEILRDCDRRTPTARKLARNQYQKLLRRVLVRNFPDWSVETLTSAMDLERSFGPVYARGLIRKGNTAFAVLGVNAQELRSAIDGSLTFGLLWLEHCRLQQAGKRLVKGLYLFLPLHCSDLVCSRLAQLNQNLAEFQIFELDERDEVLATCDFLDRGNISTRLIRRPDENNVRTRFEAAISRITTLVPECHVGVLSSSEVVFRLHGLEFARARIALEQNSFQGKEEIVFGAGSYERPLDQDSEALFLQLVERLRATRKAGGDVRDPLWRMYPERWLEAAVCTRIDCLDSCFSPTHVYVQVPAFAASDRAMIDVLTITASGRLAVIELKADEDIHLPLQGLDYWARVKWHQERDEFQKFGYFLDHAGRPLPVSGANPLLMLVAPALRVHPAVESILRYLPPHIDWELVGLDEHWREELKVVFRKRPVLAAQA
jgi:hypothetical protein